MSENSNLPLQDTREVDTINQTTHSNKKKNHLLKPILYILSLLIVAIISAIGVYIWQHSKVTSLQSQVNSQQTQINNLQNQLKIAQKPKHKKAKANNNVTQTTPNSTTTTP